MLLLVPMEPHHQLPISSLKGMYSDLLLREIHDRMHLAAVACIHFIINIGISIPSHVNECTYCYHEHTICSCYTILFRTCICQQHVLLRCVDNFIVLICLPFVASVAWQLFFGFVCFSYSIHICIYIKYAYLCRHLVYEVPYTRFNYITLFDMTSRGRPGYISWHQFNRTIHTMNHVLFHMPSKGN